MSTIILNDVEIKISDKPYYDFYIKERKRELININMVNLLLAVQKGEISFQEARQEFYLLSRWVFTAPRKRKFRNLILQGVRVASDEEFFLGESGVDVLEGLERSGNLAVEVLQAFGLKPMPKIRHDDLNPIDPSNLLKDMDTKLH